MRKYKLEFQIWGLILFLTIMLPNCIWFLVPAPHDILRNQSVTPVIDTIGSVCQILFVAALCIVKRNDMSKRNKYPYTAAVVASIALYYAGWVAYYMGETNAVVSLVLAIAPCAAFAFYTLHRKNMIALLPLIGFTICHILYAVLNFLMIH